MHVSPPLYMISGSRLGAPILKVMNGLGFRV